MRTNRLLIIDAEPEKCEFLAAAANRLGFDVDIARDAADVITALRQFRPTAVLLDLQVPGSDGIEILRLLADQESDATVLVVGGDEPRVREAAVRLGTAKGLNMAGALPKPLRLQELQNVLSDILRSTWTVEELATAVDGGELSVVYQPKLARCRTTGAWIIDGAEALLRWPHPIHGTVMPDEFIPAATRSGLMVPLTDFVLQRSLEQVRLWQSRGIALDVAVNIPPDLVGDEGFTDRLCACLSRHGVESGRLVLEITESASVDDVALLVDVMARLRLKGVRISLDDFGTGFASLKRLLFLPFNELKIDGSFVAQTDRSEEARQVVSATIELAHRLGMTACAEGVETPRSFAFLQAQGCDRYQGFLISGALGSVDFEQFLRDWDCDRAKEKLSLAGIAPEREVAVTGDGAVVPVAAHMPSSPAA